MTAAVIKDSRSQFLFTRKPPARRRVELVTQINATVQAGFSAVPATAGDASACSCFLPGAGALLAPGNGFTIAQAQDLILLLIVTNQCGDPVNLTGCTLFFAAKDCFNDQFPVIFKSSDDSLEIDLFDPAHGKAFIHLLPADTRTLTPGKWLYDVWLKLPSGETFPIILNAAFTIVRSIYIPPPP